MDPARRVGKHLQNIIFWKIGLYLSFKGRSFFPGLLPAHFGGPGIISFLRFGHCKYSGKLQVTPPCTYTLKTQVASRLSPVKDLALRLPAFGLIETL